MLKDAARSLLIFVRHALSAAFLSEKADVQRGSEGFHGYSHPRNC